MVVMVILYLVWFMVVMVILPSSSKQTWPALGGSTEEQSKNLATNTVILRYSRFTLWTHKEADQNTTTRVLIYKMETIKGDPKRARSSWIMGLRVDSNW